MTLRELKAAYREGVLPKAAYVDRMHAAHQALFAYAEFIRGTDIGRIEITDGRIVMVTREPEIKLLVPPADKRLAALDILNFDAYEKAETALLRRLCRPGAVMLDVGANIGWHSLVLAKTVPGAVVHAFEPVPATYRALCAHLELNGAAGVHPHPFGFGAAPGRAEFFLPAESVNASAVNLTGRADVKKETGELRRLDDFVREAGLQPDVLKIDVEGAELHVLQGAPEMLRAARPALLMELLRKWAAPFGYHPNDVLALLGAAGYACFALRDGGLEPFPAMDDATTDTNFVFLHAARHAAEIAALTRRK